MQHTTNTIVMVSPEAFAYNEESAKTNSFQIFYTEKNMQSQAMTCFTQFVSQLNQHGIDVLILENSQMPDAVFPNNWFSVFSLAGQTTLILYPMLNATRRLERRTNELIALLNRYSIPIHKIIDLTYYENTDQALEGTGSIVYDHEHRTAYVSLSSRSHIEVLKTLLNQINYQAIIFKSYDVNHQLIYHTNVMLSIGRKFAVICLESILDMTERDRVVSSLQTTGKTIIAISFSQMYQMAGNILELQNKQGKPLIVMSQTAFNGYSEAQLSLLKQWGEIISPDIGLIEKVGGGSARCMIAEVFHG